MNVLHVTPCFAPAWAYGGVARVVAELARAQVARGHRVSVLTTDALAPHERLPAGSTTIDGVHVVRVRNVSGAARTWLNLSTPTGVRARARALLTEQAIDVVHLHELRTVENLRVAAAVSRRVPIVVSPHGTVRTDTGRSWAKRGWDAVLGDRLLARVDQLIALSETEATDICALFDARGLPLRPGQIAVVPNGVDLSSFAALPERAHARARFDLGAGRVVLFVGRLSERNGVALLISAFADVARRIPDAQLVVAGPDHGVLTQARARVEELGLGASVRFPGHLSGANTLAAFASADLFALPAVGESAPLAALEALASGVPVLLSADCHLPQAADGGAGRIVELHPNAWADAIVSLLTESGALAAMRQRTRAVAARFTWAAVAESLDVVYMRAQNDRGA